MTCYARLPGTDIEIFLGFNSTQFPTKKLQKFLQKDIRFFYKEGKPEKHPLFIALVDVDQCGFLCIGKLFSKVISRPILMEIILSTKQNVLVNLELAPCFMIDFPTTNPLFFLSQMKNTTYKWGVALSKGFCSVLTVRRGECEEHSVLNKCTKRKLLIDRAIKF